MNECLTTVERVFVTEGVPEKTFVKPPNYNEILVDIRKPGKPVIIEGQSGTGKTTCVKKIIETLLNEMTPVYLSARNDEHVLFMQEILQEDMEGYYIIDDFHRLDDGLKSRFGNFVKVLAESSDSPKIKIIFIGINMAGRSLIQLVPDVAKRTGIHKIMPGEEDTIIELIESGCNELNVEIDDKNVIFNESKGDYWLTQQLCQSICLSNEVIERISSKRKLQFQIDIIRDKVVAKLSNTYDIAVREFCKGRRFRPSNDPYFKFLRAVGSENSSVIDINSLANNHSQIRGSINNIKHRRLNGLLNDKEVCSRYFYYDPETQFFSIEDPALFYYLIHLDWELLRKECGFREESIDYDHDIALSFASENRELAEYLSHALSEYCDFSVFYDKNYESNFLGEAWSDKLNEIFCKRCRFVVCLLDKSHKDKLWPDFERECFTPRIKDGAVIPIFLDETVFPGIPRDIGHIKFSWNKETLDWNKQVDDQIIMKLIDKC